MAERSVTLTSDTAAKAAEILEKSLNEDSVKSSGDRQTLPQLADAQLTRAEKLPAMLDAAIAIVKTSPHTCREKIDSIIRSLSEIIKHGNDPDYYALLSANTVAQAAMQLLVDAWLFFDNHKKTLEDVRIKLSSAGKKLEELETAFRSEM